MVAVKACESIIKNGAACERASERGRDISGPAARELAAGAEMLEWWGYEIVKKLDNSTEFDGSLNTSKTWNVL